MMDRAEVKDKYFVSLGVFYLLGVLANVPRQFLVVANDYWMWKFRDPAFDSSTEWDGSKHRTSLQKYFMSSVSALFQVSPSVLLFITVWCTSKLPPAERRVVGSLAALFVLFSMNAALAPLDTDSFQEFFFGVALVLALILNACTTLALVSLCELAARFPSSHYAALHSGPAICGAVASAIRACTLAASPNPWLSGVAFFATGAALAGVALAVYAQARARSAYFVYGISGGRAADGLGDARRMRAALRATGTHNAALAVAAGTTAVFFPGLMALVVSDNGLGGDWAEVYFVPVASFLTYHVGDLVGKEAGARIRKPKNPWAMLVLACLRLPLLPLLLLCNAQPRENIPVIFNDVVYVVLLVLFAASNGYVTNVCFLTAPSVVEEEDKTLTRVLNLLVGSLSVAICSCLTMLLICIL